VRAEQLAVRVVTEAGDEEHVVTQPAQPDRDVERAATGPRGRTEAARCGDEVDERLSDDDEARHPRSQRALSKSMAE
jgi:hypothetical protein